METQPAPSRPLRLINCSVILTSRCSLGIAALTVKDTRSSPTKVKPRGQTLIPVPQNGPNADRTDSLKFALDPHQEKAVRIRFKYLQHRHGVRDSEERDSRDRERGRGSEHPQSRPIRSTPPALALETLCSRSC